MHDVLLGSVAQPHLTRPSLLQVRLPIAVPIELAEADVQADERYDGNDGNEQVATAKTARQLPVVVQGPTITAHGDAQLDEQGRHGGPQARGVLFALIVVVAPHQAHNEVDCVKGPAEGGQDDHSLHHLAHPPVFDGHAIDDLGAHGHRGGQRLRRRRRQARRRGGVQGGSRGRGRGLTPGTHRAAGIGSTPGEAGSADIGASGGSTCTAEAGASGSSGSTSDGGGAAIAAAAAGGAAAGRTAAGTAAPAGGAATRASPPSRDRDGCLVAPVARGELRGHARGEAFPWLLVPALAWCALRRHRWATPARGVLAASAAGTGWWRA
mmetsp:Transcript_73273/g.197434  ORF Transcript_73273/g.197434 Transcript_73273/m.197434 type:complete len:324 (+) Transcript_73273:673-1644(+)